MTPTNHININGCIVGLKNKTQAFFLRTYPCINDYRNPDLPALLVCLMYFDQMDVSAVTIVNRKCNLVIVISKIHNSRDPYRY